MAAFELVIADTPDLLAEITALAHVIWRQHYTPIIGHEQVEYMLADGYSANALAAQQAAGTCFILARRDAHFVAFTAVSPDSEQVGTAWLDKLYVHISARSLGIGRALVGCVAREAESSGANTLRLRVNRHNAESIAAYQRIGFRVERADVKDIGNGFVMDDYIMAAPLSAVSQGVCSGTTSANERPQDEIINGRK